MVDTVFRFALCFALGMAALVYNPVESVEVAGLSDARNTAENNALQPDAYKYTSNYFSDTDERSRDATSTTPGV